MNKSEIIFVLGGCRSGKSSHAQTLAEATAPDGRLYLATCVPYDAEMHDRVERHQADRDETWETAENPIDIADLISEQSRKVNVILVDCLTLWVTNQLMEDRSEEQIMAETEELAAALANAECPVILVSNEVGAGIVPENSLARRFRDIAGFVNQRIAAGADTVYWTVAGIPVKIK